MYSLGMNLYIFGGIFFVLWILRRLLRLIEGKLGVERVDDSEYDWLDYTIDTEIGRVPKDVAQVDLIFGKRN